MSTVTAYEITEAANGVTVTLPPLRLEWCNLNLTPSGLKGTLTVRSTDDEEGDAILLHDVVTLTTATGRTKVISALAAKGTTLPDGALIALEQAARERKTTAHRAPALPRLDGAMTVRGDGSLVYLFRNGDDDSLVAVTADGAVLEDAALRARYRLPKAPDMPGRLSPGALARIRDTAAVPRPDGVALFSDLRALLARHVVWPSPHVPALLAVWVIGTYCHRLFTYYPYILLGSLTKRSGKSLVLEILAELAFNAGPPQANPTAAAIFRDLDANHSTLLFDEIESLGDRNKDDAAAILAILNVGFKHDGSVARTEKCGDQFKVIRYGTYGPKVLAGIKRPADTIRDRAVQIRLVRKRPSEKLPRFNVRTLGPLLQDLRDRLHLFALAVSPDVRALYDEAEQLVIPTTLDDRARDISEPLFAIAAAIDAEAGKAIVTHPLTLAIKALMLDRKDDVGDEATLVRAIEALRAALQGKGADVIILTSAAAVEVFQNSDLEWVKESKHATALLRKLGFVSGPHRQRGEAPARGYRIARSAVDDLWERYGPLDAQEPTADSPDTDEEHPRA